jgi:hypothetical protein
MPERMQATPTSMQQSILYVGPLSAGATSLYRFRSLQRLGQNVYAFDSAKYRSRFGKLNALRWRFPIGPLVAQINADLLRAVSSKKPDVVWLDKPLLFTPATIRGIQATGALTVCYNQDNPFGPRQDGCWLQFYKIYRMLDLHCLFRNPDIPRYGNWGLNYLKIQLSYDPREHFPPPDGWSDSDRTREVSYIGSPHEERPQFLRKLINLYGLPVTLSGPNWENVLDKKEQRECLRGGMLRDAAYRENIWKSKINLAFITHMNEEDVVHKAFEIAACRGFLLAERSPEHQACFEEGKEAEFFSTVEECAAKIQYYLKHPIERESIAAQGCRRANRSGYDNDTQLARVLGRLEEMRHTAAAGMHEHRALSLAGDGADHGH